MATKIKATPPLLIIAWLISLFATLASIYFIEIVGNPAAPLCWFERMLIFSVLLVLSVGIIRKDINVRYYVAPLVAFGLISATYQQLVHWGLVSTVNGTCNTSFACSTKFFELFGYITQATLCLVGFVVVTYCMWRLKEE